MNVTSAYHLPDVNGLLVLYWSQFEGLLPADIRKLPSANTAVPAVAPALALHLRIHFRIINVNCTICITITDTLYCGQCIP